MNKQPANTTFTFNSINFSAVLQNPSDCKNNPAIRKALQKACGELATQPGVSTTAAAELLAVSTMDTGKNNWGLTGKGASGYFLKAGSSSPNGGSKLADEFRTAEGKAKYFQNWLTSGVRPAELKGKGDARGVVTSTDLIKEGLAAQELREGKDGHCKERVIDARLFAMSAAKQRAETLAKLQQMAEEKKARIAANKKARKAPATKPANDTKEGTND